MATPPGNPFWFWSSSLAITGMVSYSSGLVSAILTILPNHQVDVTIPPALSALERLIVPRWEKVSTIYVNQMILKIYAEIPSMTNSTLKK